MTDTFKAKVQSMSAKDIILSMVNSLIPPPKIKVDMNTFGEVRKERNWLGIKRKVCYGCAATNTICEIAGKKFTSGNIETSRKRADFLNSNWDFLHDFENSIDYLRTGDINNYNNMASLNRYATISNPLNIELPILDTNYTKEDLEPYIQLANSQ